MNYIRFIRGNAPFLGAGFLLTFASSFGQTFFISVFAGLIFRDFGLTDGEWGGLYAAGTLASAVVMIWSGALTDRFRVRVLGALVLAGLAVACIAMALVPVVWPLVFVVFLLRLFGQGMASHIAQVAMARWYVAARGKALSIASLGYALGEATLPLLFVALITVYPTRLVWLIGAATLMALMPVVYRLLREERTPQSIAEETEATGMDGLQWTRRAALRSHVFWIMVPAVAGPSAFATAVFFQQVHLAEIKGWSHLELVAVFPIFPLVATASMLASGWLIDRVGTTWLMPLAQIPLAAAFLVLWSAETVLGAAAGIGLIAISNGTNATLPGAFWSEYFGTRHLGAVKALATAVMVLGSAIGPGLTGVLIDFGIDFEAQMPVIAAWFLCVGVLVAVGLGTAQRRLPKAPQIDIIRT